MANSATISELASMPECIPAVLYKYRSVNALSLDALASARVWYSKPSGLNDPSDVAARWDKNFSAKEILEDYVMKRTVGNGPFPTMVAQYVQKLLDQGRTHEHILKKIDKMFMPYDKKTQRQALQDVLYYNEMIFSGMGIFSLSSESTNRLMWAHYADSHKGFCLGFENHETNVIGQYGNPVDYVEKMPKPNISSFSMDAGGEVIGLIAYTKSLEWAYEKEWRVLKQDGDQLYPYPGRLVEVIFGLNMPVDAQENVREAVIQTGCRPEFKRASKPSDDFGLVIEDC